MAFSLLVTQAKSYLAKEIILVVNFDYQAYSLELLVHMKGKTKSVVYIAQDPFIFFVDTWNT